MSEQLEQLRQLAASYVDTGEEVIAAVAVNYGGKVNVDQPPTGIAALQAGQENVVAGEEIAGRQGARPGVGFPVAKQMAMVLTGGRILVWSRGGFKAKPKAYLGEVPLDAVERVAVEEGKRLDRLSVKLTSGWEVSMEANQGEGLADFGRQLESLAGEATWQGDDFGS